MVYLLKRAPLPLNCCGTVAIGYIKAALLYCERSWKREVQEIAIDETGLTKGLMRKLNALRKSVGDDLAEEVFAKWLERQAASQAKENPDPVAMKIGEALAGFVNDPKFNLGNHGYTLRRAKGKGASGFIAYKNEKAK